MIKIKSKKAGFRRCGLAHPAESVEYPDDRFSPAELATLTAEPMLIVEVVKTKAAGLGDTDLSAMTVEQLKEGIATYQPIETLKGVKKAELVEILKAYRETAAKRR